MATVRPCVLQFAREFFHHRRLARAAESEIADGDDLDAEGRIAEDADIVKAAVNLEGALKTFEPPNKTARVEPGPEVMALLENDFKEESFQGLRLVCIARAQHVGRALLRARLAIEVGRRRPGDLAYRARPARRALHANRFGGDLCRQPGERAESWGYDDRTYGGHPPRSGLLAESKPGPPAMGHPPEPRGPGTTQNLDRRHLQPAAAMR